jgi:hypothetical protein
MAARSRRVTANTAVEMTPLWKSQDDFHRRLQISQRTRDSHIPTPNFLWTEERNAQTNTTHDVDQQSGLGRPSEMAGFEVSINGGI